MPDLIFEDTRLVGVYDAFDGERRDLDAYLKIAEELSAHSVLDLGAGTGCLATLLASQGLEVTAVEPARASLDVARLKPLADRVRWIHGDASMLPPLQVDVAFMTGNVAQVFLTDDALEETFLAVHRSLRESGYLVFEVRDPAQRAWTEWTREKTFRKMTIAEIGPVEAWCEVTSVSDDLVSFRWTYKFDSDGATLVSDSTLRFRERAAVEKSLARTGFGIIEVRGAPDRPGKEFVFIAKRI